MTEKIILNAKIRSTTLGIEGHGVHIAMLHLDHERGVQSFGNYQLDEYNEELKMMVGKAWGMQFIMEILNTVGVEKWEDLPGKNIRIDWTHSHILGIGHIMNGQWFYPKKHLEFLEKE